MGDKGKKMVVGAEEGHFDPKSIPTKTWEEYEEGLVKKDWQNDANSVVSKESGYTHTTYRTNGTMGRLPAYASSQYTVGSHHSFTPIASSLSLNNPNQYRSFSPINPLYRYE
jgi:chitin synthase